MMISISDNGAKLLSVVIVLMASLIFFAIIYKSENYCEYRINRLIDSCSNICLNRDITVLYENGSVTYIDKFSNNAISIPLNNSINLTIR